MNFHEWVTALSFSEVLDVVLSYLKVILSWPGVVLIAVIIFRKRIAELISRIKSLKPNEILFGDVKKTVEDARAAKRQAQKDARRAARARRGEKRAERRAAKTLGLGTVGEPVPDAAGRGEAAVDGAGRGEAAVDGAGRGEAAVDRAQRGEAAANEADSKEARRRSREVFIAALEEDLASLDLQRLNRGWSSSESIHTVSMAWSGLDSTIQRAARALELTHGENGTPLSETTRWTPVEFFAQLFRDGRGSRAALRAAHNAQSLINQMQHGASIDSSEAKSLEEAIDDLKETVRKIVMINNGKKIARSILERRGSETLPDQNE